MSVVQKEALVVPLEVLMLCPALTHDSLWNPDRSNPLPWKLQAQNLWSPKLT